MAAPSRVGVARTLGPFVAGHEWTPHRKRPTPYRALNSQATKQPEVLEAGSAADYLYPFRLLPALPVGLRIGVLQPKLGTKGLTRRPRIQVCCPPESHLSDGSLATAGTIRR